MKKNVFCHLNYMIMNVESYDFVLRYDTVYMYTAEVGKIVNKIQYIWFVRVESILFKEGHPH